VAQVKKRMKT